MLSEAGALRGQRQEAAAPPAPSANGRVPLGTPIRCGRMGESQARMPLLCGDFAREQGRLGATKACVSALIVRQTSLAGGLGGGSPTQRGARGAEPARIHAAT